MMNTCLVRGGRLEAQLARVCAGLCVALGTEVRLTALREDVADGGALIIRQQREGLRVSAGGRRRARALR